MALRNGTLETVLRDAYAKAPAKGKFLEEMGRVPGVLCSHESEVFCDGYVRALQAHGLFAEGTCLVKLIATGNTERTFVVKETAGFQRALEEARDRVYKTMPTPRKVQVKMLVERMMLVIDCVKNHNKGVDDAEKRARENPSQNWGQPGKRVPVPELSSRAALAQWTERRSNDVYFYKGDRIKEVVARDDIPDDVYAEAWDVVQVREVMDS